MVAALRDSGKNIDERLLSHLSPPGREYINLTGDDIWRQNKRVEQASSGRYECPASLRVPFFRFVSCPYLGVVNNLSAPTVRLGRCA